MIDWPGPSCQRHLAYFNTLFLSSTNQGDGSRSALRARVKWFESGVCDNGAQPLNLEGFGLVFFHPSQLMFFFFFAVMNLIPSKCKFYKGDSLTLEISCLQFFSCYRFSSTSWRTVRRIVVFIVSEWLHLDLDGRWLSRTLVSTYANRNSNTCVEAAVSELAQEWGWEHTHKLFSLKRFPSKRQWDWWWVWNRCQNISVTPLRHLRGIPLKGLWGVCSCWALTVIFFIFIFFNPSQAFIKGKKKRQMNGCITWMPSL